MLGTHIRIVFVQALIRAIFAQSGFAHIAVVDGRLVAIRQACQVDHVQDGIVIVERLVHLAAFNGWHNRDWLGLKMDGFQ
jgi:hypothetical protein